MKYSAFVIFTGVLAAGLCLAFTGCEEEGTVALTVEPSFVDISSTSSNIMQTFTVTAGLRDLSLPLEWSVSNSGLGDMASQGGNSASYVRTTGAHGDNSITVRDQYGAEGVATVRQ